MQTIGKIGEIIEETLFGNRLSADDAVFLLREADLFKLGQAADVLRRYRHPEGNATFIIDRNINYTNICTNQCGFCAFYEDIYSDTEYTLTKDEILKKVDEAVNMGATQIMLQGGLNPDLDISYFIGIFKDIKDQYDIVLHSLSPPEIVHIAKNSCLTSKETLEILRDAGLDSLPGGGAEILSDETRKRISPKKISSGEWLSVMDDAHSLGLYSTATMMFGIGEKLSERIEHLEKIRSLQDRTGMFRAFIPWTFMPGNTKVGGNKASAKDYLKMLSLSRLYLDNIDNIQGSWLTQGEEIGQISLHYGANDLGSTMLEENVVRATGVEHKMDVDKIVHLIKKSGFTPAKRDTQYNIIQKYAEC